MHTTTCTTIEPQWWDLRVFTHQEHPAKRRTTMAAEAAVPATAASGPIAEVNQSRHALPSCSASPVYSFNLFVRKFTKKSDHRDCVFVVAWLCGDNPLWQGEARQDSLSPFANDTLKSLLSLTGLLVGAVHGCASVTVRLLRCRHYLHGCASVTVRLLRCRHYLSSFRSENSRSSERACTRHQWCCTQPRLGHDTALRFSCRRSKPTNARATAPHNLALQRLPSSQIASSWPAQSVWPCVCAAHG
jgi:hypothetical protein